MLSVAGPRPRPQPTTPGRLFPVLTATLTAGQAPLPPSWKRARVGGPRVTGAGPRVGRGARCGRGLAGIRRRLRSRRKGPDPPGGRQGTHATRPTPGGVPSPTALACESSSSNQDFLPSTGPVEQWPARPKTLRSLRARWGALLCVSGAPAPWCRLASELFLAWGTELLTTRRIVRSTWYPPSLEIETVVNKTRKQSRIAE